MTTAGKFQTGCILPLQASFFSGKIDHVFFFAIKVYVAIQFKSLLIFPCQCNICSFKKRRVKTSTKLYSATKIPFVQIKVQMTSYLIIKGSTCLLSGFLVRVKSFC